VGGFLHQIWHAVGGGMLSWYEAKMFIEHASVIHSDGLHVLIGVLAWLVAAMALRRSLTARLPWLVLLVLTVLNECVDLWAEQWPEKAMQIGESVKDVVLTMALPTLLALAIRWRPNLFRSASPGRRR
jgi:hypothetical protein